LADGLTRSTAAASSHPHCDCPAIIVNSHYMKRNQKEGNCVRVYSGSNGIKRVPVDMRHPSIIDQSIPTLRM
jgi:hypothetical protein